MNELKRILEILALILNIKFNTSKILELHHLLMSSVWSLMMQ